MIAPLQIDYAVAGLNWLFLHCEEKWKNISKYFQFIGFILTKICSDGLSVNIPLLTTIHGQKRLLVFSVKRRTTIDLKTTREHEGQLVLIISHRICCCDQIMDDEASHVLERIRAKEELVRKLRLVKVNRIKVSGKPDPRPVENRTRHLIGVWSLQNL